jgi:hypothetical protein
MRERERTEVLWYPAIRYHFGSPVVPSQGKLYRIRLYLLDDVQRALITAEQLSLLRSEYGVKAITMCKFRDGWAELYFFTNTADDLKLLSSVYGCEFEEVTGYPLERIFEGTTPDDTAALSIEYRHALLGLPLFIKAGANPGDYLNAILRSDWVGIIQIILTEYPRAAAYFEETAMAIEAAVAQLSHPEVLEFQGKTPKVTTGEPPPEIAASTIVQEGPNIAAWYREKKSHAQLVYMQIRGVVTRQSVGSLESALTSLRFVWDSLKVIWALRREIPVKPSFLDRLRGKKPQVRVEDPSKEVLGWIKNHMMTSPDHFLALHRDQWTAKGVPPWGRGREGADGLFPNVVEAPYFWGLPTDSRLQIRGMVKLYAMPKTDYMPRNQAELTERLMMGGHIIIGGGTGAGKTTAATELIVDFALSDKWKKVLPKVAERFGYEPQGPPTYIFLDPHGFGVRGMLPYLPLERVVLFSPVLVGSRINLYELPPCSPEEFPRVMYLCLDQIMKMQAEEYGSTNESAPSMLDKIRTLAAAKYVLNSAPTFAEIAQIALEVRNKEHFLTDKLYNDLMKAGHHRLASALKSFTVGDPMRAEPIINRYNEFLTIDFLYETYCTVSTVSVSRMLEPGAIGLCDLGGIGMRGQKQSATGLLTRIWYELQYRRGRGERPWVYLFIDEFQTLANLKLVKEMWDQGRKFGLILITLFQTAQGIPQETMASGQTNTTVQAYFTQDGDDARREVSLWGLDRKARPRYEYNLTHVPPYTSITRIKAGPREMQADPSDYVWPPLGRPINDPKTEARWLEKERRAQAALAQKAPPTLKRPEPTAWRRYLPSDVTVLPEREWRLLFALFRKGPMSYYGTTWAAAVDRDKRGKSGPAFKFLVDDGWIELRKEKGEAGTQVDIAHLTPKAMQYFNTLRDFKAAAKSKEGQERLEKAWWFHAIRGRFPCVAAQVPTEERPDMVVYDYRTDSAGAVEVESKTEAKHQKQQLSINVDKFNPAEFDWLEIWCSEVSLQTVKETVALFPRETSSKVEIHTDADAEKLPAEVEEREGQAPETEEEPVEPKPEEEKSTETEAQQATETAEEEPEPETTAEPEPREEIVIRKKISPATLSEQPEPEKPAEDETEKV